MVCSDRRSASRETVWSFARRQHGVVSHGQLVDLGLGRRAIQHRVATGKLHPVARGLYAVGRPELTRHGRWMAAVLVGGPGAALSHRSAAALWGIASEGPGPIEISVPVNSERRCPGVHVYRRASLKPPDVTERDRIPVIAPVLTLVELAGSGYDHLERAVNEADRLDLVDPETLREALERYRGRRGVARLRELLDRRTFRLTDSELERLFLPLAAQAGLPAPLTRQHLNGFRVDFLWPDPRLVVETDGLRYHRTPAQQARDRLRDQAHLAAGFTPLRFTHEQVRYEPEHVRATLRSVVRRLLGR
jgi:very-short-patch-repair endonuclease